MRMSLVALVTILLGFILGWAVHGVPGREPVRVVAPLPKETPSATKKDIPFPDQPKPPLDEPKAVLDATKSPPSVVAGDLPKLPPAEGGVGPITPLPPVKAPSTADLNADEALARRLVLGAGGEIVSSGDALDAAGKVGRSLVAEIAPGGMNRLQSAIRASLGARAVTSDGGTVSGSSTEVRKAEDELTALKKQLERAQNDFLPKAPALRNVEDAYREGERNLAEARRVYARQRLNIVLRSMPEG